MLLAVNESLAFGVTGHGAWGNTAGSAQQAAGSLKTKVR
jgi:hypothetical protein